MIEQRNILIEWAGVVFLLPAVITLCLVKSDGANKTFGLALLACLVFIPLTGWVCIPLFCLGWLWEQLFRKSKVGHNE